MTKFIYILILFIGTTVFAQVSIGFPENYKSTGTSGSLEVNGNIRLHKNSNLYLENIGDYTGTSGNSNLLVNNTSNNTLNKFDPESMPFSSITYIPYRFKNVSKKGLQEYNTRISATKFYVSIGGFFVLTKTDGTTVNVKGSKEHYPLYSARAFVKNDTWHLKFDLNHNREFSDNVNIYLNVSVYYKNFLTKTNDIITHSMDSKEQGVTKKPIGAIEEK